MHLPFLIDPPPRGPRAADPPQADLAATCHARDRGGPLESRRLLGSGDGIRT